MLVDECSDFFPLCDCPFRGSVDVLLLPSGSLVTCAFMLSLVSLATLPLVASAADLFPELRGPLLLRGPS